MARAVRAALEEAEPGTIVGSGGGSTGHVPAAGKRASAATGMPTKSSPRSRSRSAGKSGAAPTAGGGRSRAKAASGSPATAAPPEASPGRAGTAETIPRGIEDGYIRVDQITPSPVNPRRDFDPRALADLAESMQQHQLLQPIVVRPTESGYSLLAGERRWRAAQLLGWEEIPARVRLADSDAEAIALMLTENLQRENLNPMEEAEAFQRLRDLGLTQAQIARQVGRSQPRIAHSLKLRLLPEAVRDRIASGQLSFAHGRALCRFADRPELAVRIAALAAERGVSAKEIDVALPFEEQLAAEGLVDAPQKEDGWGIDECRAALARMPHRRMPPAHLAAWIAAAGLSLAVPPAADAPRSVWDAPGQESMAEIDLSGLEETDSLGSLPSPLSLSLLALVVIAAFTALLWWH